VAPFGRGAVFYRFEARLGNFLPFASFKWRFASAFESDLAFVFLPEAFAPINRCCFWLTMGVCFL
jgi:hypothetical protein